MKVSHGAARQRALSCVASMLAIASCSWIPGTDAHRMSAGERIAAGQLRDPESARFRQVKIVAGHVCGEINGKNGYGAYDGFRPFIVRKGDDDAVILVEDSAEFLSASASFPKGCLSEKIRSAIAEAKASAEQADREAERLEEQADRLEAMADAVEGR